MRALFWNFEDEIALFIGGSSSGSLPEVSAKGIAPQADMREGTEGQKNLRRPGFWNSLSSERPADPTQAVKKASQGSGSSPSVGGPSSPLLKSPIKIKASCFHEASQNRPFAEENFQSRRARFKLSSLFPEEIFLQTEAGKTIFCSFAFHY